MPTYEDIDKRLTALEKNCHEPQVDRQESNMDAAPVVDRAPRNAFRQRLRASLSDDVPAEEIEAAELRYNEAGYQRLRDHLSNVRPLPVVAVPDWLAAVLAADNKTPADVVSIHIARGHTADRGADYIPPRPHAITFAFAVGQRVAWHQRAHDRFFGWWTVKAQHVSGVGHRQYELEGTSTIVGEEDLEAVPKWKHAFDARPRPHHWFPTHVSLQEKGDSEHTRIVEFAKVDYTAGMPSIKIGRVTVAFIPKMEDIDREDNPAQRLAERINAELDLLLSESASA